MTRNEAAERLDHLLGRWSSPATKASLRAALDEALLVERRVTVERIRERLADNHNLLGAEFYRLDQIEALLDEAAR